MKYRWQLLPGNDDQVLKLTEQLGVTPLLAQLLVNRGLGEPAEAASFLKPSLQDLHDPYLMKDMEIVIGRLQRALEAHEEILIYGDYDVDGITSTAVLKRALEMLGGRVTHYIPRRLAEGYGLQKKVIERAAARGVRVIVSVDSGIRAFEVCEAARELGMDLIVTDHHLPADRLPAAYAILNPQRSDCSYPDKNLAAVGVVFKLVQGLFEQADRSAVVHHFLKLVAIGTVADMVPITGENRIMVRFGLQGLKEPYNLGLQALLNGSGVGTEVSPVDIGFKVAPRMNAFTRMGGGGEIVDLFSLEDPALATSLVAEMNRRNQQRRRTEEEILAQVQAQLESDAELHQRRFLLVWGRAWHRGVIGNVASRLVEFYHRPTLVISLDSDKCQGSGRSIPGFHLLQALEGCSEMFSSFGGHAQAVGCTLRPDLAAPDGLRQLAARLEAHAKTHISPAFLIPQIRVDAMLQPAEISLSLWKELQDLAPHGIGNPVPVFASEGVPVAGGPWLLKEEHLKLQAQCNGSRIDAIWWRKADRLSEVPLGGAVDLAFTLNRDLFRGEEKLLLTIKDLRPRDAV